MFVKRNFVTLEEAIEKLVDDEVLKVNIETAILLAGEEETVLEEGECVEVNVENLTISFTWDCITITNNDTNETIHNSMYINDDLFLSVFRKVNDRFFKIFEKGEDFYKDDGRNKNS